MFNEVNLILNFDNQAENTLAAANNNEHNIHPAAAVYSGTGPQREIARTGELLVQRPKTELVRSTNLFLQIARRRLLNFSGLAAGTSAV